MAGCATLLAVWCLFASFTGKLPLMFSPVGLAFQLTTVLFAVLPALGLAWFVWHIVFRRRFRLHRLRRLRVAQGRTTNLLAPPPVFGAACKKADHEIDRNRSE